MTGRKNIGKSSIIIKEYLILRYDTLTIKDIGFLDLESEWDLKNNY